MCNATNWQQQTFSIFEKAGVETDILNVQAGVPLTIDFKTGSEAMLDKSIRACGTIGFGMIPMASMTFVNTDDAQTQFKVCPYIKAEVGVFAGICMKVRASYTMGNFKYLNKMLVDRGSVEETFTMRGKSIIALSLVFMPLSMDWERSKWW